MGQNTPVITSQFGVPGNDELGIYYLIDGAE